MKRFRVKYKGIIIDVYHGEIYTKSCLFLYGFPATIGNNEITSHLITSGYIVLQPHYPGTYDSDGEFTPESCMEMCFLINEAIVSNNFKNLKNGKPLTLPRISLLIGNSFGSFIALKSVNYFEDIEKIILIAPAITYGKAPVDSGFMENGTEFLDYVRITRPYTYRLGNEIEWQDFYLGKLNTKLYGKNSQKIQEVIGIVGDQDESFKLNILKSNFNDIIFENIKIKTKINLFVVLGGGHSLSSLITESTLKLLNI